MIEKSKSPSEASAWTKLWDILNRMDKGSGVVDVSRACMGLSQVLVGQREVLRRLARLEAKLGNGIAGRAAPTGYVKVRVCSREHLWHSLTTEGLPPSAAGLITPAEIEKSIRRRILLLRVL